MVLLFLDFLHAAVLLASPVSAGCIMHTAHLELGVGDPQVDTGIYFVVMDYFSGEPILSSAVAFKEFHSSMVTFI